jgi:hypothetical protein
MEAHPGAIEAYPGDLRLILELLRFTPEQMRLTLEPLRFTLEELCSPSSYCTLVRLYAISLRSPANAHAAVP